MALQEVENRKVVKDRAAELKNRHDLKYKVGFVQGRDTHTEQDVAFLVEDRPGNVKFLRVESAGLRFRNRNVFNIPSKHVAMTVTRQTDDETQSLTIINAHLKAGRGTSNETQRKKQSRVQNRWATTLVEDGHAVIITGDFNASKRHRDSATQCAYSAAWHPADLRMTLLRIHTVSCVDGTEPRI